MEDLEFIVGLARGGGVDADNVVEKVGGFLGYAKSARFLGLFLKIVH